MGKYFGTDGFRGEVNIDLCAKHAYKIGCFLGYYLGEQKRKKGVKSPVKIVIGRDTRASGDMLQAALVAGITASGGNAYLLKVTTTPSVAYIANVDKFDCGVMISASHNPYFDNGIKLIGARGEKFDDKIISLIENYLDGNVCIFGKNFAQLPCALRENIGKVFDCYNGVDRYISYLISLGVNCNGLKVGLDCANGSASIIAPKVFKKLGASVKVINAQPNGININHNAGSTHISGLCKFVVENNLDVGFAYDGDADRCLCVDEKGNVVTGDHILYICGRHLKTCGKLSNNTVVVTVMSNMGLFKAFDDLDINYYKTDVGDKYVSEYIKKTNSSLGGEASGHIIFSQYAATGDGILTSLKIIEVMLAESKKLSQLSYPLHLYPQVMLNVKVSDKDAVMQDGYVLTAVEKAENNLGSDGRVLVRKSGTEPLIRVMVEAKDENICRATAEYLVNIIKDKGYAE